jgi:hypothetical protein
MTAPTATRETRTTLRNPATRRLVSVVARELPNGQAEVYIWANASRNGVRAIRTWRNASTVADGVVRTLVADGFEILA